MVEENLDVMQSLQECVRETRVALGEEFLTDRQRQELHCREVVVLEEAWAQLAETRVALQDELAEFSPDTVTRSDSGHGGLVSDAGGLSPECHQIIDRPSSAWSDEPGASCEAEEGCGDSCPAGAGSPLHPRDGGLGEAEGAAGAPSGGRGGLVGLCGAVAIVCLRSRGKVSPDVAAKVLQSLLGALAGQSKRFAEVWKNCRKSAFTARRRMLREGVHYPRTGSREYVVE